MTFQKGNQGQFLDIFTYGPVTLGKRLSIEEFTELAIRHPDLQMEREKTGKTTIMFPVKRKSGNFEFLLSYHLGKWMAEKGGGEAFSPSTGILLPTGEIKSPDLSWISEDRLEKSTDAQDEWLTIVPDFVAEIRSSTDKISNLKKKMEKVWMANGVQLGWLIDPYTETAFIYRQDKKEVEKISGFKGKILSGEKVMEGMELPLEKFSGK